MSNMTVFDPVKAQIVQFAAGAKVVVVDDSTKTKAMEVARDAKTIEKRIEEIRTTLVKPLNDRVKEINKYAKDLMSPIDEVTANAKHELRKWEMKLEKERQEQIAKAESERKAAEAAAKAEAELDGMFGGTEAAQSQIMAEAKVTDISVAHAAKVASIEQNKVSGARKVWTFQITDESLIPREFLVVDEKKIRAAMNAGTRHIAGVNIFQETSIAIR